MLLILPLAGCGVSDGTVAAGDDRTGSQADALTQCAGATVAGIDVSDVQQSINWWQVRAGGIGFAFMKATQGTYNTQGTFAASRSRALVSTYSVAGSRGDGNTVTPWSVIRVSMLLMGIPTSVHPARCGHTDPSANIPYKRTTMPLGGGSTSGETWPYRQMPSQTASRTNAMPNT